MEKQRIEEWVEDAIKNNISAKEIIKLLLKNGYDQDEILEIIMVYDERKSKTSLPQLPGVPPPIPQQIQQSNSQFPQFPEIGNHLEGLAKSMNQGLGNMPRISLPTQGYNQNPQQSQLFSPYEQQQVSKIKKWAFIVSITIVLVAAGIAILKSVLL